MKKVITAIGIGAAAFSVNSMCSHAMEYATVNTSALNVRSNPDMTTGKVVGIAYGGNKLIILEKSNGWCKIKTPDNIEGWCATQYLSFNNSDNEQNDQSKDQIGDGSLGKVVVSSRLNIRCNAGVNYDIVGKVSNNEVVQVISYSNGWYKVKLQNGTVGWASQQYITSIDSSNNGSDSNSNNDSNKNKDNNSNNDSKTPDINGQNGKITKGISLNVRSGVGTSYPVVGYLQGGDVVKLLAKDNGWYNIEKKDGSKGWISGIYVTLTSEDVNEDTSNKNSGDNDSKDSNNNSDKNDNNSSNTNNNDNSAKGEQVVDYAYTLLGSPYEWGASGPKSFDCSGFTQYVYKHVAGINLPRVSTDQATRGAAVTIGNYKVGDLVYFDTSNCGRTNHVGIYVGNGKFISATGTQTNPDKVKVYSLTSSYWEKALLGARRLL